MPLPNGWITAVDALNNPDAFLEWINNNISPNRLIKKFHPGTLPIRRGMAVCVYSDGRIYPFDTNNTILENTYVGVLDVHALVCTVVTYGPIYVQGSGWQKGIPYFAGPGGILTSTEPSTGLSQFVGVGIDTDRILVMPSGSGGQSPAPPGPSGESEIDGGSSIASYMVGQQIEGGSSTSVYTAAQVIDGGNSD